MDLQGVVKTKTFEAFVLGVRADEAVYIFINTNAF